MRTKYAFAIALSVLLTAVSAYAVAFEGNLSERTLPVPALLEDTDANESKAAFSLTPRLGQSNFIKGKMTPTMGYNGSYLGPTLKTSQGDFVSIRVTNMLPEETTVHWHGFEVPGEMDGGPHQVIEPLATWTPSFTVSQPAFTGWYHPHGLGTTATQVSAGLAGFWIHDDQISQSLSIPKDYGVDDFPIAIQNRRFNIDGSFDYSSGMMEGVRGGRILVNGAIRPYQSVAAGLVRLRLLNGANATNFTISFSRLNTFYQIASDQGFLAAPLALNTLTISPGERAEILLNLVGKRAGNVISMYVNAKRSLDLTINDDSPKPYRLPTSLTDVDKEQKMTGIRSRHFNLQGTGMYYSINGLTFNESRVNFTTNLGAQEVWTVTNQTTMMHRSGHPFHVHGVRFQVLTRNGGSPKGGEQAWKDTIYLSPGDEVVLLMRFNQPGMFMYHCHILEHEEWGMMGQFMVV